MNTDKKQVVTKSGEVLEMNNDGTEVFHFGTWKEVKEDDDGLYIWGGLNPIYFDYLTPVNKGETNTQPLYKVLNEVRTQGKWEASNGRIISINPLPLDIKGMAIIARMDKSMMMQNANAEYSALAVNNFSIIADLLDKVLGMCEYPYKEMATYKEAKEALAKIS